MPEARIEVPLPPLTRASPPTFDAEHGEVYGRAIQAFETESVPYLLGGAVALNHNTGVWRDTKDLDFFVRPEDADAALDALANHGFTSETVYESWLGKGWRGEVFVDVIWRNANACFPVTDAWFKDAEKIELLGLRAPVMRAEELILSKIMVGGRHRCDIADVLHTIHASADRLDWDRMAHGAGEHIGLLLGYLHFYRWGYPGWADHVPLAVMEEYEMLAQNAVSRFGPFRARLLDLNSFSVDVVAWGLPDPHAEALREVFGNAIEGRS